ncbi:MAG: N-acetyl-gamma-glutamyl-phosphate reductase [Candidatus Diapherotrites archaeon]
MIEASIVGASGYTGGELFRLLLNHPDARVKQAACISNAGKKLSEIHPNLRKRTDMKFCALNELQECDVLFLATPHGIMHRDLPKYLKLAPKIVDLSADYRLKNPAAYPEWYGFEHENRQFLEKFVYGIPELHREEIKKADFVSGAGCIATSAILALYPLREIAESVVIDSKVGSSASGSAFSIATHHPERCHAVRPFKATMHRHTAEIEQETGLTVSLSAHAIELVRGISSTLHITPNKTITEKDAWGLYRNAYSEEPFIRIVKERSGVYRYPEPKIVAGTNFCDIGFELDSHSNRLVVFSAIDNICRGSSGQAVQCMNLMLGFEETAGLKEVGLHPC